MGWVVVVMVARGVLIQASVARVVTKRRGFCPVRLAGSGVRWRVLQPAPSQSKRPAESNGPPGAAPRARPDDL